MRWVLQHADRLIVHTQAEHDRARTLLPHSHITITPHPTYADFQTGQWSRETARWTEVEASPAVVFGSVRPYKSLPNLIEALPTVLAEVDVGVLVEGEIWGEAAPYHEHVGALNLADRVWFVDRYVPNEEATSYFAVADLVILPYRDATESAVLQLAFGLGAPVIATRTGGMSEAVEDGVTGFVVEPGGVAGLGRAIARRFREESADVFQVPIRRKRDLHEYRCAARPA